MTQRITEMAGEPLPCPFCGGTDLTSGGDDKIVIVWCRSCEAQGPNQYGSGNWNHRAALPHLQHGEWQPIETCPKNRRVLISEGSDEVGECAMAWLDRGDDRLYYAPQGGLVEWKPTHWMPIPVAPAITSQDHGEP